MFEVVRRYLATLVLAIGSCVFGLLIVEALLTAHRAWKYRELARNEVIKVRRDMRHDAGADAGNRVENSMVLHPFFGYTYNPKDKGINNFGFYTKYDIALKNKKYSIKDSAGSDSLVVGIFGGSFARDIGNENEYIEKKLKSIFPRKKPVVINFAIGGHALPQTALIYIYFREMLDVFVFIDGLNEVWNYVENNRAGVPPEYAKAVHYMYKISREELTPLQFEITSKIVSLKRRTEAITKFSLLPFVRQSLLVHHAWNAFQNYWSKKIAELSVEVVRSYDNRKSFFHLNDDSILTHAAHQWAEYHKVVHYLAAEEGVLSFHVLQPNPFVPNSKKLTVQETKRVNSSYPVREYVVNGYPKLQAEMANLQAEGMIIEDLTSVFRLMEASIWIDSAHVSKVGARVIADRVVDLIKAKKNSVRDFRS